jgi:hypothetical protein
MDRVRFGISIALHVGGVGIVLAVGLGQAKAQTVDVLGIHPVDGDAEIARDLTGAIKHAASQHRPWTVNEREISLAQMTLAHGCDEPNADCLTRIAQTLQSELLIYGSLARSAAAPSDLTIELHLFSASQGAIVRSVTDRIPRARSDVDDLREPVRRYIAQLAGVSGPTVLRIRANVPDAPVSVDGRAVGTTDAQGDLTTEVTPGAHSVEVVAEGYEPHRGTVTARAGTETPFPVNLVRASGEDGEDEPDSDGAALGPIDDTDETDGGGSVSVPGVIATVVGVGLLGGWVYSLARIQAIPEDADFKNYLGGVPMGTDACTSARNNVAPNNMATVDLNRVRDLCDEADTVEVTAWVFGVSGAVALGVGVVLLAAGAAGDEDESTDLSVAPYFDADGGGLAARVGF